MLVVISIHCRKQQCHLFLANVALMKWPAWHCSVKEMRRSQQVISLREASLLTLILFFVLVFVSNALDSLLANVFALAELIGPASSQVPRQP